MRLGSVGFLAGLLLAGLSPAHAEFLGDTVKIGVMNDQNGPYADIQGPGSVEAVRMAVEDFGGKIDGHDIEVIVGDHQNKPDIGTSIARRWFEAENVGAIVDIPQSAVALGVAGIAHDDNRVALISASNLDKLTREACSPNQVQWGFNNYSLASSTANAIAGPDADTWFLIVVDLATGHDLQAVLQHEIEKKGGKVVGAVRHPLDSNDFSSYLLQAQASGAKIIAFADATSDFVNAMKQAAEYGIGKDSGQQLVGITVFEPDIMSLGLDVAQGTTLSMPFYWDLNDQTRAFSKRFSERFGGKMPTVFQAGAYSAALHYFKGVQAAGGDSDGAAVVRAMKKIPVEDPIFGKGTLRADGLNVHPMHLFKVKSPDESKGQWDLYKLVKDIAPEDAFQPMDESKCPYLKEMMSQ
jgi:branched-chain amino acid transport system substrate-binding protein